MFLQASCDALAKLYASKTKTFVVNEKRILGVGIVEVDVRIIVRDSLIRKSATTVDAKWRSIALYLYVHSISIQERGAREQ